MFVDFDFFFNTDRWFVRYEYGILGVGKKCHIQFNPTKGPYCEIKTVVVIFPKSVVYELRPIRCVGSVVFNK